MELQRLKNQATSEPFPLISTSNRPEYFTGTIWGDLTSPSLIAYHRNIGGSWTIFSPVLSGTPTELGSTGLWYLALTAGEMNYDFLLIKLNAGEIDEQTIIINTVPLTNLAIVDSVVDDVKAKTENLPASPAAVGSEMNLDSVYDAAKTTAQAGDEMKLEAAWDAAKTAAQATALTTHDTDITNFLAALNDVSTADVVTALKGATGWTRGGTQTFLQIVRLLFACIVSGSSDATGVITIDDYDDDTKKYTTERTAAFRTKITEVP